MKKYIMGGITLAILVGVGFFAQPPVSFVQATNNDNVTICHKNNGNGWSKITVDDDAVNGQGNGDHNSSGHQNGQDIIPAGYWDWNGRNWDATGQAIYNNNCNVPTPSPTPSPSPTATPTPSPSPTVTPSPTPTPEIDVCSNLSGNQSEVPENMEQEENACVCQKGYHEVYSESLSRLVEIQEPQDFTCEADEEEPTPTPTPTETPKGNDNPPTFAGSSTNAPVCSDGSTINLPANPHVWRNGSSATVNWFQTEGDSANIYYKEVNASEWQHSVSDVKVDNADKFGSVTINNLDPKLGYTFGIQQKKGCGGGQTVTAVVIDGPESMLFQFSYWEWSK